MTYNAGLNQYVPVGQKLWEGAPITLPADIPLYPTNDYKEVRAEIGVTLDSSK